MVSPARELRDFRKWLISTLKDRGCEEGRLEEKYAQALDQYISSTIQESHIGASLFRKKTPFALVAVGGYGRGELFLYSDIDIMVLFKDRVPEAASRLVRELIYPLWDLGLEVGYGTRTIPDCVELSGSDFTVLTSLLDSRLICGDSLLFLDLIDRIQKNVIKKKAKSFADWLKEQDTIRSQIYDYAIHPEKGAGLLLEPNLKEGMGGLRDYHHMLWLAKVFLDVKMPRDLELGGSLSHGEFQGLRGHLRFLGRIRNQLHLLSGRRNDRLWFEYQEKIAHEFNYKGKGNFMAVEYFLTDLHSAMNSIRALYTSFTRSLLSQASARRGTRKGHRSLSNSIILKDGQLSYDPGWLGERGAKGLVDHPLELMRIFQYSASTGAPLSLESRRLVKEFLFLMDSLAPDVRAEAFSIFLDILSHPWAFEALKQMSETGLLDRLIPEFGRVKNRVQFDSYHVYPVGLHMLQTLKNLKELGSSDEMLLTTIFSELEDQEILLLAALFHDIGKSGQRGHAKQGAEITRQVLGRFHFPPDKVREVAFLVHHHLLLIETATRRDIEDEKTVIQCARTIGTIERLKMLYLLTWADARATGPRAWNTWIGDLAQTLFFKVLHILDAAELATQDASLKSSLVIETVERLLVGRLEKGEAEEWVDAISPRYVLNVKPEQIVEHILMARNLKTSANAEKALPFVLDVKPAVGSDNWTLTFIALDRPGLFSDMTGVLALHNISILSAHIYTWRNGIAVDLLKVSGPPDPLHVHDTWARIRKDLQRVFEGKFPLAQKLRERANSPAFGNSSKLNLPPSVSVDNSSSDFFTIIEVRASDTLGLLYTITRNMFELGLDIKVAKIATHIDQALDVFYVRDFLGQKIEDPEKIDSIKKTIEEALSLDIQKKL